MSQKKGSKKGLNESIDRNKEELQEMKKLYINVDLEIQLA